MGARTADDAAESDRGTRGRILDAALALFGEASYPEANLERIAERAGCSRPALYQYFASKEDVFWALAAALGADMVALADRLGTVSADEEGVAHLRDWVRELMDLHEAWAPVFASFPTVARASSGGAGAATGADITDHAARALLKGFGLRRTTPRERLARVLVMVLIRCSFYAEHAPQGMSREPMVVGLTGLVHRTLAGPIDGVNVVRSPSARRRHVDVVAPVELAVPAEEGPALGPRGVRTRERLLAAGAAVLPRRGFHDLRVDDIADAAGVGHGTFYLYFDSKDDFFRALATVASDRMLSLLDELSLDELSADGAEGELRSWLGEWFDAYEADGGVISTWQDMRTSPELRAFSQAVGAGAFLRLERLLSQRDFGHVQVDTSILLALLERAPYLVHVLGAATRPQAVDAVTTTIRRGLLGLA